MGNDTGLCIKQFEGEYSATYDGCGWADEHRWGVSNVELTDDENILKISYYDGKIEFVEISKQ